MVGGLHDRLPTFGTGPMFITSCEGWVNGRDTNCKWPLVADASTLPVMLFMVMERFKSGDPKPIGERFRRSGRMLPADVLYQANWMDAAGARCFQIMEAPNLESLNEWIRRWDDLVDFEIVPVLSSGEYWATIPVD